VVNFAVVHQEIRRYELNEAVHHLLQVRCVSAEGHWREEHRSVAPYHRLGDLPAGVILDAHAGCLQPAVKATQTVGQFHFMQMEGLDFRTVPSEHVQEPVKSRGQIPVRQSTAIEDYDLFAGHEVSFCRRCYHLALLDSGRKSGLPAMILQMENEEISRPSSCDMSAHSLMAGEAMRTGW
jgi:hypothetical protein